MAQRPIVMSKHGRCGPGFRSGSINNSGPYRRIRISSRLIPAGKLSCLKPRREASDISQAANIGVGAWPEPDDSGGAGDVGESTERGGRSAAIELLRSILAAPGTRQFEAEHAVSGAAAYKALAPFLELGTLSVREAWQAAISARQQSLQAGHEMRRSDDGELYSKSAVYPS